MNRSERDDLSRLLRQRTRVAKHDIDALGASRLAHVEQQLSAEFEAGDEAWNEAKRIADEATRRLNIQIAQICDERGIPASFRPSAHNVWIDRGENASPSRRVELRRLAERRLEAMAKQAKVEVDRREVELLAELITGSLTSSDARAFLKRMPTPEALLPAISLADLGITEGRPAAPRSLHEKFEGSP